MINVVANQVDFTIVTIHAPSSLYGKKAMRTNNTDEGHRAANEDDCR